MTLKEEIVAALKKALSNLKIQVEPTIESSANLSFGDYTSNIALRLKIDPQKLAKEIQKPKSVEKIEIKDGFINFWLSKEYLLSVLPELKISKSLKGQKIMVEFTDPNPFKEFHVGHLYSNSIGESISRLLETLGATVARINYQGDVGLHVAKTLYGINKVLEKGERFDDYSLKPPDVKAFFLGRAYAYGAKAYEEDDKAKKDIVEINRKIYKGDTSVKDIYEKGKKWSLGYFEDIYKRLGTKFDKYYFESEVADFGAKKVLENQKIFKKSDGATIFEGEKYGLHNRVFINSQGLPTYEAKELGLAFKKFEDFKDFDESIIITGNEIVQYFKVVMTALRQIKPEITEKTKHISHGMVRFPGGKISSRLGNVLSYSWLIKAVKDKILEEFKDMDEKIAEQVSLGAIKYALLKSRVGSDIEFDIQKSISLEGDSGPYIQYAYVRTQSVLEKAVEKKKEALRDLNEEELLLLRTLNRFPEVVQDSALSYSPNILCSYLFELAKTFNLFYQKHQILDHPRRIKITASVGEGLNKGLTLLGIESPDRM